ncbi:hypothetical protein T492DRAFT_368099 [Pavlovales sp. CCMP2436]|nr:hypothetical protein T492DRAFT_368099 [Pavlovales sp. CCMP2436]
MGNVFSPERPLHERFDLLGPHSSPLPPSADLSSSAEHAAQGLKRTLHLGGYKRAMLLEQVALDCKLLEQLEVVDFSLRVGIHFTQTPADKAEVSV